MNKTVWVISDLHFNHLNMMKYENRPANFNDIIIKNCNKYIKPEDKLIVLGDVILGNNSQLGGFMASIPGKKILCKGNHDHESDEWYEERGFDFVCDYYVYNNLAFSHAPLTPLPLQTIKQHSKDKEFIHKTVDLNIHGHFHRGKHREPKIGEEHLPFKDRYYDYTYFNHNREHYKLIQIEDEFRPYSLEEVLAR